MQLDQIYSIVLSFQNNNKKPKSKNPIKINEEKVTSINWELLDGAMPGFLLWIFFNWIWAFFSHLYRLVMNFLIVAMILKWIHDIEMCGNFDMGYF